MGIYTQRGAGASRTSAHNQGKYSFISKTEAENEMVCESLLVGEQQLSCEQECPFTGFFWLYQNGVAEYQCCSKKY